MLIDDYLIIIIPGVFLLVAGGIFAGFFLLAIEIAFKRRKEKQQKEIQLSRNALTHWRKSIEVNNEDQNFSYFFFFFFLQQRRQRSLNYESDNQQQTIADTDQLNQLPLNQIDHYNSSDKTKNLIY